MTKLVQIQAAVKLARRNAEPNIVNFDEVRKYDKSLTRNEVESYLKQNLSAYELACGYVQIFRGAKYSVELYREHGMYHVRCTKGIEKNWTSFEKLADARKDFARFKKLIK